MIDYTVSLSIWKTDDSDSITCKFEGGKKAFDLKVKCKKSYSVVSYFIKLLGAPNEDITIKNKRLMSWQGEADSFQRSVYAKKLLKVLMKNNLLIDLTLVDRGNKVSI